MRVGSASQSDVNIVPRKWKLELPVIRTAEFDELRHDLVFNFSARFSKFRASVWWSWTYCLVSANSVFRRAPLSRLSESMTIYFKVSKLCDFFAYFRLLLRGSERFISCGNAILFVSLAFDGAPNGDGFLWGLRGAVLCSCLVNDRFILWCFSSNWVRRRDPAVGIIEFLFLVFG